MPYTCNCIKVLLSYGHCYSNISLNQLSKTLKMNKTVRSSFAIIAGFVTIFVLAIVTDIVLEKARAMRMETFSYNALWIFYLVVMCRLFYSVIGGYITAWLAPDKPVLHTTILGILTLIVTFLGTMATWHSVSHSFLIILIILPLPCTWIGGKIRSLM